MRLPLRPQTMLHQIITWPRILILTMLHLKNNDILSTLFYAQALQRYMVCSKLKIYLSLINAFSNAVKSSIIQINWKQNSSG